MQPRALPMQAVFVEAWPSERRLAGDEYALFMRFREAHVIPGSKGAWEVVEPGARSVHSQHATKREAVEQAKDLLQKRGGGEAIVHGRDGTIRESDRVAGVVRSSRRS